MKATVIEKFGAYKVGDEIDKPESTINALIKRGKVETKSGEEKPKKEKK